MSQARIDDLHTRVLAVLAADTRTRSGMAAQNFQETLWLRRTPDGKGERGPVWELWPRILQGGGWGLTLSSPPRTGKDFAARYCAVMRRLFDDAPWESWRAGELVAKAELFDGREAFYDRHARYRGTLILSDAGREPERGVSYITDLFDIRYDLNLKTIITTNLGEADFIERFGRNCLTRTQDGGWFVERDYPPLIVKPAGSTLDFVAEYSAAEAERRARHEEWLAREREHEIDPSGVTPEMVEEMKQRIREGNLTGAVRSVDEQTWVRAPLTYEEQVEYAKNFETNTETVSNEQAS